MIEISIALLAGVIAIWLYHITSKLESIAEALRKIADTRTDEISLTVPGNKEIIVNLPNGKIVTKEVPHEPATH